jgi:hypothetical protein
MLFPDGFGEPIAIKIGDKTPISIKRPDFYLAFPEI